LRGVARRRRPDLAVKIQMRIKKHDKSYIVELEDRSKWRIWPGDIAVTLQWLPTADIVATEIEDEFCTHALVNRTDGSRMRAIEAGKDWPVAEVRRSLKDG
jgi:hypothetical protein